MNKIFEYVKNNKIELIFVLLIFIVGLVLRIISFQHHGEIWMDELYTWYFAKQDNVFLTIFTSLKDDIHMPLYFVLMHFWIKLFGDSVDSMRICSLLISIPIPIVVFYVSKSLFGKTCAYFASIFVAINTFCIYYSQEIRFYGLALLLSIFVALYFVRMLENFNKKNATVFVVLISLLFYTFSVTPLLIFCYFIVGIIYLLRFEKRQIKKFILTFFAIGLVCFPALVFTILNAIAMKAAITYYPIDNYKFSWEIVYDILENFFSLENYSIVTRGMIEFPNINEKISNPIYFVCAFLSILVGLFYLLKSFFSKNKRLLLLLSPSLLFVFLLIFLAQQAIVALQARYLIIVFGIIVISFCFGLTSSKNKILAMIVFDLFICFNLLYLLLQDVTIFNMYRAELRDIEYITQNYIGINENDYWIVPMSPKQTSYFIQKGKMIPFDYSGAIVLKDKKSLKFYFGEDYKDIKRENVKEYLKDGFFEDIPNKAYEDNLKYQYIDKLKKNERIIYIPSYAYLLKSAKEQEMTHERFKKYNLVEFLFGKCLRDTKLILDKYLNFVDVFYGDTGFAVFVYEKP